MIRSEPSIRISLDGALLSSDGRADADMEDKIWCIVLIASAVSSSIVIVIVIVIVIEASHASR